MKTFSEIITFANRPTGSGQIYTEDVLKSAFDIYMSKDKDLRRGCIDAPVGGVVTYDICSHYLLDVWWEEDTLWGEIEIATSLPKGKILEMLIDTVPETMTLGLAAMAAFKPAEVISRDLFEVYEEDYSKTVDDMAVLTVYVLPKANTNH
mgnify:CR=1 FL=1|jgi:hypothetical protein